VVVVVLLLVLHLGWPAWGLQGEVLVGAWLELELQLPLKQAGPLHLIQEDPGSLELRGKLLHLLLALLHGCANLQGVLLQHPLQRTRSLLPCLFAERARSWQAGG